MSILAKFKAGLRDEFRRKTAEIKNEDLVKVLDKTKEAVETAQIELAKPEPDTAAVAVKVDEAVKSVTDVAEGIKDTETDTEQKVETDTEQKVETDTEQKVETDTEQKVETDTEQKVETDVDPVKDSADATIPEVGAIKKALVVIHAAVNMNMALRYRRNFNK